MASFWYNTGILRSWHGATGEIDFVNDTIKIAALETDSEDTDHEFMGDVLGSGVEVTSTGYTSGYGGAGRLELTSKALAVDQANDRAEFDCANPTWSSISQAGSETWVAFVVLKEITNDAASPVIAHIESTDLPLTPNGSDITLTVDAEGLLHKTQP
jgi:hypothetical protein